MLKQMLDFILNEERLDQFFILLLWLGPLTGLAAGTVTGLLRNSVRKNSIRGLLIGSAGTLVSTMWYIYNIIMDHFGLDSVAGLLINLLLFVCIGLMLGLILRYYRSRQPGMRQTESDSTDQQ